MQKPLYYLNFYIILLDLKFHSPITELLKGLWFNHNDLFKVMGIGPPGVDPEPATAVINIQMEPVPAPPTVVVQAAPVHQIPQDKMEEEQMPPREVRLPVALEQALAFKTERAKQLGVRPEEMG